MPTGPVPAVTTARLLCSSPAAAAMRATAATAVVFEPLESSITDA